MTDNTGVELRVRSHIKHPRLTLTQDRSILIVNRDIHPEDLQQLVSFVFNILDSVQPVTDMLTGTFEEIDRVVLESNDKKKQFTIRKTQESIQLLKLVDSSNPQGDTSD